MDERICPSCFAPMEAQWDVCESCSTRVQTSSASPRAPHGPTAENTPTFPGYRLIRSLGEGGMGAVFLAEEESLGRNVALKVVSRRIAGDALSRARFLREARTLATIEHPNVVRVYSFGDTPEGAFLVMEYVEGETLTQRLERLGRFDVDETLRIAAGICEALQAAWERRVIHRDIKPANILIDRRNEVRVADFGLAKPMESSSPGDVGLTQSGYMLGTPHYLSPEQAQGSEDVDFRSDIYALGIMLFQMLTGQRPFDGTTPVAIVAKHLHQPLPSLATIRPDVPGGVERMVQRMTAKDREERPTSYEELRAEIAALRRGDHPSLNAAAPPQRRKLLDWAVLAIVALIFGALMMVPGPRPSKPNPTSHPPDNRLIVAVTPFYGPDEDSAKEGRVMAALIERAVQQRIGAGSARVIGIEETKSPVRDHDEARELGEKLNANAVIWGEAFALRNETEVQPHVTIVRIGQAKKEVPEGEEAKNRTRDDSVQFAEADSGPLRLDAEAPNQIELRKTSASGVGDVVVMLAAIHALESKRDAPRALAMLGNLPRSAETLRYEAKALLQLGENEKAKAKLSESLAIDASHTQTLATMGDIEMTAGRYDSAYAFYDRAEKSGQPYTAFRGFVQNSRLYANEFFQNYRMGSTAEASIYFLEIDPRTGRTLSRVALPGPASKFVRDEGAITIEYYTDRERRTAHTLAFRNGTFGRPLPLPRLPYSRIRSVRSGTVLADNFLGDFAPSRISVGSPPVKLRAAADPEKRLPTTLVELENALRQAIARDPTQPWHPFFLSLTLRELGKGAEAEREFRRMLGTAYPGTPYYEFAWMMSYLERMRISSWVDALYPKALAQRNLVSQPAGAATLIERLINTPFTRPAAANRDLVRGRLALERARALTGLSLESDDVAAAAWIKYFRQQGEARRAADERAILQRLRREPLNYTAAAARIDYLLVCTFAAWVSFMLVVLIVAGRVIWRVRSAGKSAKVRPAGFILWIRQRIPRTIVVALVTALAGSVIAGLAWATAAGIIDGFWVFVTLNALGLSYILKLLGVGPLRFAGATQPAERRLLALASLVAIVFTFAISMNLARIGVMASLPLGTGDALGHPDNVAELEKRLAASPSDAGTWVTAASNHYAGNEARARELYAKLGSDPRVARNLIALDAGSMPVDHPTTVEIGRAFMTVHALATLEDAAKSLLERHGVLVLLVVMFIGIGLLWLVRPDPHYAPAAGPDRIGTKTAMVLLPGLYDIRRGNSGLGYALLFGVPFVAMPLAILMTAPGSIGASPFSIEFLADIAATQPMPFAPGQEPMEWAGLAVRLAFPWAHLFWSAFLVAGIVVLSVHAWRVLQIVRKPGPAAKTLQPVPAA